MTAEEVASWYRPHDVLGVPGEQVLAEELDEDQMVERVLADLSMLRTGPREREGPTPSAPEEFTSPPSAP